MCEIPVVSDNSAGGAAAATLAFNAQNPTSQPISSARCPSRKHAMPSPVSPTALETVLKGYGVSKSQNLVNGFTFCKWLIVYPSTEGRKRQTHEICL